MLETCGEANLTVRLAFFNAAANSVMFFTVPAHAPGSLVCLLQSVTKIGRDGQRESSSAFRETSWKEICTFNQ